MLNSLPYNLPCRLELKDGRFKKLLEQSKNLSPQERGELFQNEAGQVLSAHQELAMEGQTEVKIKF